MTFGPIGPFSDEHAEAEARRARERLGDLGRGRTFAHDVLNAALLLPRLLRRARRKLRRTPRDPHSPIR